MSGRMGNVIGRSTVAVGCMQPSYLALRVHLTTLLRYVFFFFFSSRRRHTRLQGDWSSDVCSSDLYSLRNYLLHVYPDRSPEDLRPKGAGPAWESLGEEIKSRLELPEGKTENAL